MNLTVFYSILLQMLNLSIYYSKDLFTTIILIPFLNLNRIFFCILFTKDDAAICIKVF